MDKTHGQIAYEAYATSTGNKSINDESLLKWLELPAYIKLAWETAAKAVHDEIVKLIDDLTRHA